MTPKKPKARRRTDTMRLTPPVVTREEYDYIAQRAAAEQRPLANWVLTAVREKIARETET